MNPPISRLIREQKPYPFARLDALKKEVAARGVDVIDLSIGDPGEVPPQSVIDALQVSITDPSTYPRALGRQDLREACAAWLKRRFGVECDPEKHVLPINGSKEAIWHLPFACLDVETRPVVLWPEPGYPVYDLGTKAAGGESRTLPLSEANDYLADLADVSEDLWAKTSILWLNYPHNPTGAEAPKSFYDEAVGICREHGVLLASDEAYCDTYFGDPPPSALECGLENVVSFYTLSKRSAVPGLRSGFMAGDETVIDALKKQRPGIGVATPDFIQVASIAAWEDEAHTEFLRKEFAERHAMFRGGLKKLGFNVGKSNATIYVWCKPPGDLSVEKCAEALLNAGVVAVPGEGLGEAGAGYLRFSITDTIERLREALGRIENVL